MSFAAVTDTLCRARRPLTVAFLAACAGQTAAQSPLATPEQAALDRQALRVFASSTVQGRIAFAEQALSADPYAETP